MLVCVSKGLIVNCGIQTGFQDQSCLHIIVQKGKNCQGLFVLQDTHISFRLNRQMSEFGPCVHPLMWRHGPSSCTCTHDEAETPWQVSTVSVSIMGLWESSPRLLLLSQWLPSQNLTCTDARLGELELKMMTLDCRWIVFSYPSETFGWLCII